MMHAVVRAIRWGDRHIPRGLRAVAGVLCVLGGLVGFLPILGFWMVPVGLALIALEVPSLRTRLLGWVDRHEAKSGRMALPAARVQQSKTTRSPGQPDR
jgi:hypothetical protein